MNIDSTRIMHVAGLDISPWVYGPVLFALWVGVLFLVQHIVLRRLRRSTNPLASGVARAVVLPVVLAVVVVGLLLLERLLPLPSGAHAPVDLVVKLLLILIAVLTVDRVAIALLVQTAERIGSADLKQAIVKTLIRVVVYVVGILVILGTLGVSITPVIASLGVASLAVALALQGPLTNLFAGLLILADRSLRVGDFIVLDSGEKGYIERIGLRHTSIRMLADDVVIVPNEKLVSSTIHNTDLPSKPISIRIQVGVHYDSDLRHVEEVTIAVGRHIQEQVEGAVPGWEPLVRYHTFDSSSINFTVILRVQDYVAGYLVKHEFIKALHARYREEGIVIPFPLRTLDIPDKTAEQLRRVLGREPGSPGAENGPKETHPPR